MPSLPSAQVTPRPDQLRWLAAIDDAFRSHRVVCAVARTGFGKTFCAAHKLRDHCVADGSGRAAQAIFLARLDAIITDTAERLTAHGVRCGIVQADRPTDPDAPVQVCSVATVQRRGVAPDASLVIVDECHGALSGGMRAILSAYPNAQILGLTATPQRADGQPLGDVFETLITGPTYDELVAVGALVRPTIIAPSRYLEGKLYTTPSAVLRDVTRPAIVFCQSIEHAVQTVAELGDRARLIVGDTPRSHRESIRSAFRSGDVDVLVGVDVFREGFDEPPISCVVLARRFEFIGSWMQAIGRGVRSYPGKRDCIVYDLAGSYHLLGSPDEPVRWNITGDACVRTSSAGSVYRCQTCGAIWPTPRVCPNCGAEPRIMRKLPRVLRRSEEAYLMEHDPDHRAKRIAAFNPDRYRDAVYRKVARTKPPWLAARIADQAVASKRQKLGLT